MVKIVPNAALDVLELLNGHDLAAGKVSRMDLCVNLDSRVRRNKLIRNRHALVDGDALLDNGVVLHVAHTQHAVNLGDAQKVQNIGHEELEPHVLDTCNVLGSLEVLGSRVAAALARVVDEVLGDLAKGTTLFAEVNDNTGSTGLGLLDGLANAKNEVGSASANVRTKDVRSVALVVHTQSQPRVLVTDLGRVAENVSREPTDRGQKDFNVATRNELGVRAARDFKKSAAQRALVNSHALSKAWQIPNGLDGNFGNGQIALVVENNLTVNLELARTHLVADLAQLHVGLSNGNGWSHVNSLVNIVLENPGRHVAKGVHGHELFGVAPLGEGADLNWGLSVGKVGLVVNGQVAKCDSERLVDGIGTGVGSNGIAVLDSIGVAANNNGPARQRVRVAPVEWNGFDSDLAGVGRQRDAVRPFARGWLFSSGVGTVGLESRKLLFFRDNNGRGRDFGGRQGLFGFLRGDSVFKVDKDLANFGVGRVDLVGQGDVVLVERLDCLEDFCEHSVVRHGI